MTPRFTGACLSSIASWAEPCRSTWCLMPTLPFFEQQAADDEFDDEFEDDFLDTGDPFAADGR